MAPIRIPEGFVFVPGRSYENAKALLEAAESVKGDRVADVRTVTGGYHVTAAVAEEYQKAFPDAELEQPDELIADDPNGEPVELVGEKVENGQEVPAGNVVNADGTEAPKDENGVPVLSAAQGDELEPLPVTADNTRDEIDAYGKSLDPKVDTTKAANKSEAIALLEAARKPQNPAE